MSWKTTRALSATLFVGIAGIAATNLMSSAPSYAAQAAAPTETKNKALVDALNGAQADFKAGRFAEALAKAKEADGIKEDKPAALNPLIHGMIIKYAIEAKDYASALAQIDKNIAANEGTKLDNLKQAMSISFLMKDNTKAQAYAAQLGNNLDTETRLFIASQMANAGQTKEALAYAAPALQGNPTEAALKFQQAVYFKMNDPVGRRAALEQLVSFYPKLEYWHDLLQLARNEKGLTDEQTMDIYRLRLAVGDMKTGSEYLEMAQQALLVGYPAEAKAVVDKGIASKALTTDERVGRLTKMTGDRIAADTAVQSDLQKKSATDPNAGVKLGLIYWTFGKNKESEDSIRAGMAKGKLSDPDAAKVALGHTLLSQGKKPEAVTAFDSVAKASKEAPIARLWSIYARKA